MRKIFYVLFVVSNLCSCVSPKHEVERITDFSYVTLTDSIFTRMPGELFYCDKHLVWVDPFSSEGFVHVLDASSGKEIGSFGRVGSGPHEFSDCVDATITYDSLLMLYDANYNFQVYVDLNKVGIDTDSVFVKWERKDLGMVTRYLEIGEGQSLQMYPGATKPFVYIHNNEVDSIGNFPIPEKISNGFNVYQGAMLYNPIRRCLFYFPRNFPYAAMYKFDQNKWMLDWEKKGPVDYRIIRNKLKLENISSSFHEATLSKDYIVFTKRDEEKEGKISEKEELKMDMMKRLPYSIFLYDYDFNLKKIIRLDAPVIRLAGDVHSNTLYAIIVNPEYSVIRLELPE